MMRLPNARYALRNKDFHNRLKSRLSIHGITVMKAESVKEEEGYVWKFVLTIPGFGGETHCLLLPDHIHPFSEAALADLEHRILFNWFMKHDKSVSA